MTEVIDNGRIFTFDELKILLFACGVKELEGIYMPDKIFDEEEVIYALHHMAARQIISVEGEGFFIREDVQRMLEIMGNPVYTYIWRPNEITAPEEEYFCYISETEVVVSERYWKKKDSLKIRQFSLEEFERWKELMENDHCGC